MSFCNKKFSVKLHDPQAEWPPNKFLKNAKVCSNLFDAFRNTELIIIFTAWTEYKDCNWQKATEVTKENIIFDTQNSLDKEKMTKQGFEYYGIGQ